jgi:hypothetical protein
MLTDNTPIFLARVDVVCVRHRNVVCRTLTLLEECNTRNRLNSMFAGKWSSIVTHPLGAATSSLALFPPND